MNDEFKMCFGTITQMLPDPYSGTYTVTPSEEAFVLNTKNKSMADNVIIEPIPNTYGRVTWNGSVLTIE